MPARSEPGDERLVSTNLAARDPAAEHIVIWDQAGFHPKPGWHTVPARMHLVSLPPYSPELNPTEAIGDVIKDRIGNVLWHSIADLEQAISEELRPLCKDAENVMRLVAHPWLVEQANATAIENSAITCSKWYNSALLNHQRLVACLAVGVLDVPDQQLRRAGVKYRLDQSPAGGAAGKPGSAAAT